MRHTWDDVPERIILGVGYDGFTRWLAQGVDPYQLIDGALHDSRGNYPDGHANPTFRPGAVLGVRKAGVYVTDPQMSEARWKAALAFHL